MSAVDLLTTTANLITSNDEEYTGFEWVKSKSAIVIAGIGASIGIAISLYNIIKHITYYTLPEQQLFIIRILFIVPLYAIVSWLSMNFKELSLYFESIRDIYEAFVIYCFLILILGYVGGEANCISLISLKPPLKHPYPLCCLPRISLNVRFLRFCKQSCIQFIIVKPIMALLNIIMLATGHVDTFGYKIFTSIVYNIAYTLALYGLLLFYLATKADIRAYSPVRKFFAVKIVIFATYWQGLIVSYAPGLEPETADLWNDFILSLEMSVFAVVHLYSFPWWEFRTGMPSSKELKENAKKVLSFKDVVRDVYHNVAPAYQTYVLQTDDGTVKQYKTKTYMVGNLNDPKVHNKFMPNFAGLRDKYGHKNGKYEKGFGQKKNYVEHTDEYDPEVTETELDYDPRMHYNGDNNTTNEDTEISDSGLAVVKDRTLENRYTSHQDDEDEDETEESDHHENGAKHVEEEEDDKILSVVELGDVNIDRIHSSSQSKSFPTPDSATNLLNGKSDSNNINIGIHPDNNNAAKYSEDGDDELDLGVHVQ